MKIKPIPPIQTSDFEEKKWRKCVEKGTINEAQTRAQTFETSFYIDGTFFIRFCGGCVWTISLDLPLAEG